MGNVLKKLFGNKEMRILMLGLDAAGKTSTYLLSISFFVWSGFTVENVLVRVVMAVLFERTTRVERRRKGGE